jgi:hypothetical protein
MGLGAQADRGHRGCHRGAHLPGRDEATGQFNWGLALKAPSERAEAIEKLDKAADLDSALKPKVGELRKELQGRK